MFKFVSVGTSGIRVEGHDAEADVKVKFETLHSMEHQGHEHMELSSADEDHTMQTMMITPELLGLLPSSSSNHSDGGKVYIRVDLQKRPWAVGLRPNSSTKITTFYLQAPLSSE